MRNKFSLWCLCLSPSASCSPVRRLHNWLFWLGPEEPRASLTYPFFFSNSFWSAHFCSLQFTPMMAKAHLRGERRRADFQRRLRGKGSPWVSKETNMFYIKFPWKKNVKRSEKCSSRSSWLNAAILTWGAKATIFYLILYSIIPWPLSQAQFKLSPQYTEPLYSAERNGWLRDRGEEGALWRPRAWVTASSLGHVTPLPNAPPKVHVK